MSISFNIETYFRVMSPLPEMRMEFLHLSIGWNVLSMSWQCTSASSSLRYGHPPLIKILQDNHEKKSPKGIKCYKNYEKKV